MILIEDLTDVTLANEDTNEDDEGSEVMRMMKMMKGEKIIL